MYPTHLMRALFSNVHKSVGLRFLWLALLSVCAGMTLSLVMRVQLANQFTGAHADPVRPAVVALLHGSVIVFFVIPAAPQCGFGYFLLPLQMGAREMAFPLLSGISFWMTAISFAGISTSVFMNSNAGATVWLLSVLCFCGAMLLASLNLCVTAIAERTRGMTLPRLPI